MRARMVTAALVILATLVVLAVGLMDPALSERIGLGDWGQAASEAVAAVACALAAARTRSRARLVWGLFAAGLGIWAFTDGLHGFATVRGWDVGEVSLFDVGWLSFYGPMLAGAPGRWGSLGNEVSGGAAGTVAGGDWRGAVSGE